MSTNYYRWRESFLLVLGKYSLDGHVISDASFPDSPDWVRTDCVVKSWLQSTLSPAVVDAAFDRGVSARVTWLGVDSWFLGNRDTRALILDAEFRHTKQGDLTITDYCRKIKGMADDIGDLGEVIPDRTLVLNLICGLNERYLDVGRHLRRARPFPSFLDARNDLLLEELNFATTPSTPSSALLASSGKTSTPPAPKPPRQSGGSGGGHSGGQKRNKQQRSGQRSGNTKGANASSQSSSIGGQGSKTGGTGSSNPSPDVVSIQNPWTCAIYMWPGLHPFLAPIPRPPQ